MRDCERKSGMDATDRTCERTESRIQAAETLKSGRSERETSEKNKRKEQSSMNSDWVLVKGSRERVSCHAHTMNLL